MQQVALRTRAWAKTAQGHLSTIGHTWWLSWTRTRVLSLSGMMAIGRKFLLRASGRTNPGISVKVHNTL